jgi:cysteine desulfurase/selenocysteine lyase
MTIATIREDFPALAHCTHLNTAGMAPLPRPVIAEWLRISQQVAEYGPALLQAHDEDLTRDAASHQTLAAILGVDADEIAFTTQFSTAVNIVLEGLPWQPGDEVVITDQEHPAMLTPLLNIARRHGVIIRRVPVVDDDAAMLNGLEALLRPRTRLIALSHVTTETGTRLPAAEMARLAHDRGALVFYDGAQSLGQFAFDLRTIDCDFYAIVGYKWLLGPYPSAALYMKRAMLDRVDVTWTGSRTTEAARIDMGMESLAFLPTMHRFEYGGRVFSHDAAMAAGAEYVMRLGLDTIAAHARRMTRSLHEKLDHVPGARITSTRDLDRATGIVTIGLDGMDGPTLAAALRERWNMLLRAANRGTCVRVSIAAFTDERDLDLLVDALATLASGR